MHIDAQRRTHNTGRPTPFGRRSSVVNIDAAKYVQEAKVQLESVESFQ